MRLAGTQLRRALWLAELRGIHVGVDWSNDLTGLHNSLERLSFSTNSGQEVPLTIAEREFILGPIPNEAEVVEIARQSLEAQGRRMASLSETMAPPTYPFLVRNSAWERAAGRPPKPFPDEVFEGEQGGGA